MRERIQILRSAVEVEYECQATHVDYVHVIEKDGLVKRWEGIVEVFDLVGHSQAARCYAWRELDGINMKCTTVLQIPPITSAQSAVRATIANDPTKTHPFLGAGTDRQTTD